jgi:predicted alpha-1,2-mannosidase
MASSLELPQKGAVIIYSPDDYWSFNESLMKKPSLAITLLSICAISALAEGKPPVLLANPLQGTDSFGGFSHGNEYPSIALPFPMNAWAPYTQPEKDSFYYQYRSEQIRGIRQTHMPSPWMGDYATFSLMPVSGKLVVQENERASKFRHEDEIAQPSYYKVHLDDWKATAEVTPTERAARFRFSFEKAGDSYVVLDVFESGKALSSVQIIPGENKVIGIARNSHGGVPKDFGNYFVIAFDQPFAAYGVWSNAVQEGGAKLEGGHVGAYLKFDANAAGKSGSKKSKTERDPKATGNALVVTCKVASSYISPEQAMLNLEREVGNADFDTIRQRGEARWNEMMNRARVEGGSEEQQRTFYSGLYRALMFPEKFYELDAQGLPVHYSPYDGKVHAGVLYTDSGFWDTFRAAHPLYNLLYPEVSAEIQQSLINTFEESGWLPEWPSPGHRGIMIGENSFSLMADAWVKGVRQFNAERAVAAMVHDANNSHPQISAVGRDGASFYNSIGYVPYDNKASRRNGSTNSFAEATAKTLEFAYDDFCAAQLAHAIGKNAEAATFAKHAMNYTNLFDPSVGFMRGRKADGTWDEPFYPEEWGGPFTEGCSWHWTWCVFQDVPGLIKLIGGDKAFADKLDAVFTTPNTVRTGSYGGMIHEMTEMVAANMGQYAHGNEPIHHMIYLYDYAGQPWKAQARLRQVMALLYQPTPDGLCGDEDTGEMSAWYVFSALGFYPVCPGDVNYIIGTPLFDKATLTFAGGKTFTITAKNNGPQEPYINKATLNGNNFDRTFISHQEIVGGGELMFQMSSAPNHHWGSAPESRPTSALAPLIGAGTQ